MLTQKPGYCSRAVCMATLFLSGCTVADYRADQLPQALRAPSAVNLTRLDMTGLAAADAADGIRPGDKVRVTLHSGAADESAEQSWQLHVDTEGNGRIPLIGPVSLAGLTQPEAEQAIATAAMQRRVFLTPAVSVDVTEQNAVTIEVNGAVRNPGTIKFRSRDVTLADLLGRSGGLTESATGRVRVSRQSPRDPNENVITAAAYSDHAASASEYDLTRISPESLADIHLTDGSVIHVENKPEEFIQLVGVIGNRSLQLPGERDLRLLEALSMAGGPDYSNWISDRVVVTRMVHGNPERVSISASIRRARADERENLVLKEGDIINVEENLLTFSLSTLQGLFGVGRQAVSAGIGP